jgi:hypothetical protein
MLDANYFLPSMFMANDVGSGGNASQLTILSKQKSCAITEWG